MLETEASLSLTVKKPRVEEEDDDYSLKRESSSINDDDDDDYESESSEDEEEEEEIVDPLSDIEDEETKQQYRKYFQQIKDSQGFDIDFFPTKRFSMLGCYDAIDFSDNKLEFSWVKRCTHYAIQIYNKYNKAKSELKLEEIEKANATTAFYFITFRATDQLSHLTHTYQAKVFYHVADDYMELRLFRKKGQKKGMFFYADFNDHEDYEKIKKCADFAILMQNKEERRKCKLELAEIVSAAFRETSARRTYYITLEARDTKSRLTALYISKVRYDFEDGFMAKLLFRPKGEKKGLWSDDEENDDNE